MADRLRTAEVERLIQKGITKGVRAAAEDGFEESQRRVPYRTRELMDSGKTVQVNADTAAVVYTDSKAAAAHENMFVRYRHGRQAKFLENAVNARRKQMLVAVANEIKRVIR